MKPTNFWNITVIQVFLFLASILLFNFCSEEYQYTHGNIIGTITDATTGDKISGCTISVSNSAGDIVDRPSTDGGGGYRTKDLVEGIYLLSIEKKDYFVGANKTVQVKAGENTKCDIALARIPAPITAKPEELDFGSTASTTSSSFGIVNDYPETLAWYIGEYDCKWIASITPNKGTLPHGKTETIIVKIDRTKLDGGDNKTIITVTSENGQGIDITIKATGALKESPLLNISEVSDIDKTTARFSGEIIKPGIPSYTRRGFTCSMTSLDDSATELSAEVNDNPGFSYLASGLIPGKKYYVRAFAVNASFGKVWSANEISFTTISSYPQVRTDEISSLNLSTGSCTLNGYIEDSGNPSYSEKGFCVSDHGEPTISDTKYTVSGSGTGSFSTVLSGLVNEHTYRIRAYAIQNGRAFYGSTMTFSTSVSPASVATTGASSITHSSAILNGTILKDGTPKYTERGFCYSTYNRTPTITDSKVAVANSSSPDFSYHMTNLEHNKTFWFRAYAIQNGQPTYGEVASFETVWSESTVFTVSASNIKYYEMTLNGQINAAGTPAYTQKGFCYSIWYDVPTLNNSTKVTVPGTSEGPFSYHLKELAQNTTYYYRAFVIQDGKTLYGDVMSSNTYSTPLVITTDAYATPDAGMMNISWTIELNGVYGFKGNPECNDFGFVYGPGDKPSADNPYGYTVVQATKIEPFANGEGYFSVTLNQMPGYSKYYYRAYAKTSLGYTYGDVMAVSTQP